MVRLSFLATSVLFLLAVAGSRPASALSLPGRPAQGADTPQVSRSLYLGTWQRTVTDATGSTRITIQVRDDGSYTKVLDAFLRGQQFHNSEVGSWSVDGPVLNCSGDGNAPASRHDLRLYQKLP